MKRLTAYAIVLSMIFWNAPAWGAPIGSGTAFMPQMPSNKVGIVAAVRGVVKLQKSGQLGRVVESGEAVYQGDVIKTDKEGILQLLLMDETIFTIGPNSSMTIEKFLHDPDTDGGKIAARVHEGTFRFITGRVGRKKPSNMEIKLPTGVMAVRGTMAYVIVKNGVSTGVLGGPGKRHNTIHRTGSIIMQNEVGKEVEQTHVIEPGKASRIDGPGLAPTHAFDFPQESYTELKNTFTSSTKKQGRRKVAGDQGSQTEGRESERDPEGQGTDGEMDHQEDASGDQEDGVLAPDGEGEDVHPGTEDGAFFGEGDGKEDDANVGSHDPSEGDFLTEPNPDGTQTDDGGDRAYDDGGSSVTDLSGQKDQQGFIFLDDTHALKDVSNIVDDDVGDPQDVTGAKRDLEAGIARVEDLADFNVGQFDFHSLNTPLKKNGTVKGLYNFNMHINLANNFVNVDIDGGIDTDSSGVQGGAGLDENFSFHADQTVTSGTLDFKFGSDTPLANQITGGGCNCTAEMDVAVFNTNDKVAAFAGHTVRLNDMGSGASPLGNLQGSGEAGNSLG